MKNSLIVFIVLFTGLCGSVAPRIPAQPPQPAAVDTDPTASRGSFVIAPLAYSLFGCGTGGAAPFYGKCIYGTSNQLRGYTAGRYLDEYMFATQLEYRVALPWRLGVTGFGGLGGVAPEASRFRSKEFLPAGGTGARFALSRKYHVNLRTDFAWGKDNFTWSVGVGEAF